MGYTTKFIGFININPPIASDEVEKINRFCSKQHSVGYWTNNDPLIRTSWCDWKVSQDGSRIYWNGSEKSYDMHRWLPVLIDMFLDECTLNGEMYARGEDDNDVWILRCVNNNVSKVKAQLKWVEEGQ